jgi:hypothetical protein
MDSYTGEEGNNFSVDDYKVLSTCHKAMGYWKNYCRYLQDTSDVPEYAIKSLWDLQMYTSIIPERKKRQTNISGPIST